MYYVVDFIDVILAVFVGLGHVHLILGLVSDHLEILDQNLLVFEVGLLKDANQEALCA